MKKQYSILFIGNSMTYFYDMPTAIFEKMAKSAGYDVYVRSITAGGRTLQEHLTLDDEPAKAVAAALDPVNCGAYDFVVIQEAMPTIFCEPDAFYEGAWAMVKKIRALGAAPFLYARVGNQRGNPEVDDPECTYEGVYQRLVAAYHTISEELDMKVAWTIHAVHDLNEQNVAFDLYDKDLSHPSYAGSYIAALTVFSVLFGVDPTTITYDGELAPADAVLCREAARKAVFETPNLG